ncbi:myb family transcription factor EFM [Cocos nucifera]|uniref:Myb family transcription factor EFM n=1 Tax=Cocos nucifera TaxID=13894 RepID=A0A8K0NDF6_COCNU|nr:myb family transcription factor EFM [Cocos nucifera]
MKSASGFLKEAWAIEKGEGRTEKVEECVKSLEEERRKIEAFKRELPLCMHLIGDVIQGLKEELEQCRRDGYAMSGHVLEEFMPIKSKFEQEDRVKFEDDTRDKMNWMSSAQLWSDNYSNENKDSTPTDEKRIAQKRVGEPDRETSSLESRGRSRGGAFVPFKGLSALAANAMKDEKPAVGLPDLSLLSPGIKDSRPLPAVTEDHRGGDVISKATVRAPAPSPLAAAGAHLSLQAQQQTQRKPRRCWSPELHRRFVAALLHLGGAQVATPKQIRELMKVDGLTNDEVKSHLQMALIKCSLLLFQKYRLHARKVPNASAAVNHSVVVMGDIWVPQEHYSTSQKNASQSGSPQSPLQLAGAGHTISITAGDSCEEEDGKSESYSWK